MPQTGTTRIWRFGQCPAGNAFADAFTLETGPVPAPGDGEVLIRNEYISLDAGTRMWITPRSDGYQPPLPPGVPEASHAPSRKEQSAGRPLMCVR